MKVLHLTTFKKCGIADYFNYLIKEIDNIGNGEIVNDVFPVDVDWQKNPILIKLVITIMNLLKSLKIMI
ncbi:hypothetical protein [Methanobrevibacter arboriphilus]|uniref:hypothetical protein n=1 Tax=Methanobrevibacter arboriphilus TaxID=39441 RepID=UPI0006D0D053|nr:hypothetical protein [Methanobrevibacter arboriphilus]